MDEFSRLAMLKTSNNWLPNQIPSGWRIARLAEHINLVGGYAFNSTDFVEDGIPLIRIGSVNSGEFDNSNLVYLPDHFAEQYQRFLLYPGDLVITLTGTVGKEDYGNVCLLGNHFPRYFLNQRVAKFVINPDLFATEYVAYILKHPAIKKSLTKPRRGVRQANISNEDILSLDIPIPPLSEQKRIAVILAKADRLRRLRRYARELSDGYLQAVFLEMFGDNKIESYKLENVLSNYQKSFGKKSSS